MDIRKMTDEELAGKLYRIYEPDFPLWQNLSDDYHKIWLEVAKFTRLCVKDSQKELVTALKNMIRTHGMHGPCEYNNCGGCDYAYKKAQNALHEAMEGKDNEEN